MHIVIIGGGFAGVNLALALGKSSKYTITVVDKNNYNFFPPLIYQVATGFLEPSSISYPFRKLFAKQPNTDFRLGYLEKVIPEANKVILSNGELSYDYLVFATGARTNFFGMENVQQNAIAMKTLDDAIDMRNTLLSRMEQATLLDDPEEVRKLLTIVIAGGGPTGVELSGMFAEMRNGILRKEYPELVGKGSEIYLIDGSEALLSPMSLQSQKDTYEDLSKLGVK
ncbi:MAG TPA: FAD-dependent oxidoreductase, partial [Dyadobacter sp.]|nr:FAD-dependent oxidoreductase [Dyadobacter sp.]